MTTPDPNRLFVALLYVTLLGLPPTTSSSCFFLPRVGGGQTATNGNVRAHRIHQYKPPPPAPEGNPVPRDPIDIKLFFFFFYFIRAGNKRLSGEEDLDSSNRCERI